MRRWLIWCAAIGAAVLLMKAESPAGTDVGKLDPAQVLRVNETAGYVTIGTDMGQLGQGRELAEAVEDMKRTAAGQVFLDTAEYLLLTPSAEKRLPELARLLRPSCRICLIYGAMDLQAVADYLSAHEPELTLGDWKKNKSELPILIVKEERMYLENP